MAEFLRPEARQALYRWREVIAASGGASLGLWWGLTSIGIMTWIGWILVLVSMAFGYAAVQRLRFHPGAGGPGVVQVAERQIAYFGPLTGGVMALDDVIGLEVAGDAVPPHWRLRSDAGEVLDIPLNAEGAEVLFDAFSSLPGMRTERLIAASRTHEGATHLVWRRRPLDVPRIGGH
ncbi:hypothetical protein JQU17_08115 [Ponticoccus sp. SC2-23]|uniref:hypothetical protein n=1 Tax=Alexandriicola marinus TaxID=2081710 RepID=UPI000FD768B1|nr:hypothetical protein [Alexandriicola marinus]MBM1220351.1 hypothetical protein [Ponticoccus sp. SC6-9]MBM1225037.1 hypothetical protein [Ponticoccus sp. SC6-15]MBM1228551.1 hypothetical protein [Ponticoccus sp. SC6-38]MBM1233812.1 hypothetical protein [Ponticoccus sp. SC6-45]MBM1239052.1 hypothetical protein [Ponticoccus sp. SC6-49]MBM1242834.1 hypothetical protein [Ponticoccus sp. SC2-64]MBM1247336.1 hypothetical protein [Ponticoccus sp. SC6-42]MBM1252005.1 hypothetical protein [Pontico